MSTCARCGYLASNDYINMADECPRCKTSPFEARMLDDEFNALMKEHYAVNQAIRDLHMTFHCGERRFRIIPGTSDEALAERSARLDELQAQEKDIRTRLIAAA